MEHRHLFSTSQMFEGHHNQNWNQAHAKQTQLNLVGSAPAHNAHFSYPMEHVTANLLLFPSQGNVLPRPNGYSSSSQHIGASRNQPVASCTSHDSFLQSSTVGTFNGFLESYSHPSSSFNHGGQPPYYCAENAFVDPPTVNGRGSNKRRCHGIPSVCERTSRYYRPGSSTEPAVPSESWHAQRSSDPQPIPWDLLTVTSGYEGRGLSIVDDAPIRNARSRSELSLEPNRISIMRNPPYSSHSTWHPIDYSRSIDTRGRFETSRLLSRTGGRGASRDVGSYCQDAIQNRSSIPRYFHGNSSHSGRVPCSSFSQQVGPAFRPPSSSGRMGHFSSDEALQLPAEQFMHRHPISTVSSRTNERNVRSYERYQSLPNGADLHKRVSSEDYMVFNRSAFHGSRADADRHRDMQLDVDNMSYEELLALGERIGNVNTGLSKESISKCLTETVFCSADQTKEEGNCVICLEEYEDMGEVGALKACGHRYHGRCIKKWLSMKNLCPVCKGSALADKMEE